MQVTAALIATDGKLLVAQRPPWKKFGLLWEFPGGKVEPGESLEQSLVREINEELCLDIRVLGLFRNVCKPPDSDIDLHAYWCEILGGTIRLVEHVAFMWVDLPELKKMDLTNADRHLIPFLEKLSEFPDGGVSREA